MRISFPNLLERNPSGDISFRVGLSLTFYMFRPHVEVARSVIRALEVYREAVGPDTLKYYADYEGDGQLLDKGGWDRVRQGMLQPHGTTEHLFDESGDCYRFMYSGRSLDQSPTGLKKGEVCNARFWLPTEFLEVQGPVRVRELALAVAAPLPLSSGHAGLSFNGFSWMGTMAAVRKFCFRYPGMDISDQIVGRDWLGTHIDGVHWLNFLGQPALSAFGGVQGLRARLHSLGTTVQAMEEDCGVITLGEWPEAGDTEKGEGLPAYRELAHVLEPWFYYEENYRDPEFPPPDKRRWERRFLD